MNIYWKTGIALAAVLAAFLAGWIINGMRWQTKLTAIEKAQVEEKLALEQQATAIRAQLEKTIIDTAAQYQTLEAKASKETAELKKELKNAQKKNPLPDGCRLDADRLRIIQNAVTAANHRAP